MGLDHEWRSINPPNAVRISSHHLRLFSRTIYIAMNVPRLSSMFSILSTLEKSYNSPEDECS